MTTTKPNKRKTQTLFLCIRFLHHFVTHSYTFLLSALGLPGPVGEVCRLVPNLEKSLEEIMELAESGMKYTQMPHVMEVKHSFFNFTHYHQEGPLPQGESCFHFLVAQSREVLPCKRQMHPFS